MATEPTNRDHQEAGLPLRIEQESLSPRSTRIWLDGNEISNGLSKVSLSLSIDDLTTATLTILVNELVVDGRFIADLNALVRDDAQVIAEDEDEG